VWNTPWRKKTHLRHMGLSFQGLLIHLRWVQLRRAFPIYGLVLLGLAVCTVPWLVHRIVTIDQEYAYYIAGGVLLSIVGWHQRRPDLDFVRKHLPFPHAELMFEYALLSLPVVLGLWSMWMVGLVLIATSLIIPWMPAARVSRPHAMWLRALIPAHLFEWKSAVQRTHPFTLLLWVVALALCWLPILPLFLLWLIVVQLCGMQEDCEPRSMLLVTTPDAKALLRTKTSGAVELTTLLVLPVLIGATIFQPQWWWIHLLFGLGQVVVVAFAVLLKYSNYVPNERLTGNGAVITTAAMFSVLPGLFVVPLIMLLTERRKALANLHYHFHGHPH